MSNTVKVTSITLHKTALGDQMAITYSKIGDGGNVISQNKRAETVVVDLSVADSVSALYDFAQKFVEEKEEQ